MTAGALDGQPSHLTPLLLIVIHTVPTEVQYRYIAQLTLNAGRRVVTGQQPLNLSYIIPDLRHFHVNEDVDVVVTDSTSGQYRIGRSAHSDSTKR